MRCAQIIKSVRKYVKIYPVDSINNCGTNGSLDESEMIYNFPFKSYILLLQYYYSEHYLIQWGSWTQIYWKIELFKTFDVIFLFLSLFICWPMHYFLTLHISPIIISLFCDTIQNCLNLGKIPYSQSASFCLVIP